MTTIAPAFPGDFGEYADQAMECGTYAAEGVQQRGECRPGRVRTFAVRSWRVTKAVWKFAKARCPKWLVPVMAVCLAIPGPVDELLVLGLVAYPVLRSREARTELAGMIRQAWNSISDEKGHQS